MRSSMLLCFCASVLLCFCASVRSGEIDKSNSTLNPTRVVEVNFSKLNEPIVCSFDDVPKGSKVKFQIKLANKSETGLVAVSIKASCGCLAGLANSVSIPQGETGSLIGELEVPNQVGEFEKTLTLTDDHDDKLILKIRGKVVLPVEFVKPSLVIKSKESESSNYIVVARSPLGLDLTKFQWKAVFESDCKVECKRSETQQSDQFELHFKILHSGLSDQTVSSVLHLEATQPNSALKISDDLIVYLAFNSVTTPRRLALRKSGELLRGSLIVHSPDFVDDTNATTANLRLRIGPKASTSEAKKRSVVFECVAKKIRSGSYLMNIQFDPRELGTYDEFESWVLTMEEGREWFAVPVLFE